jgi:hypothetical protein
VGYLPGDVLVVDMHRRARARDVVCAEVHARVGDRGDVVFRVFEPPFLAAKTPDDDERGAILVDDKLVIVRGVVVCALKPRRSRGS